MTRMPTESGTSRPLSYAIITPVHNEASNLPRLAAALESQTERPTRWVIVDDGSNDGTPAFARDLTRRLEWVRLVEFEAAHAMARGAPIVRSFTRGLLDVANDVDVIVKLDADVSMRSDYFERLLSAFRWNGSLGMASGSAYELADGEWKQRFGTGTSVWGAARAYRRRCLEDVLPLEERMGWDTVDEHKAQLRGWQTRTLDLPFHHHRRRRPRRSRYAAWKTQGDLCHYLGYRPFYLVLRAVFQAARDPAAIGLLTGYLSATVRREPLLCDAAVRSRVRENHACVSCNIVRARLWALCRPSGGNHQTRLRAFFPPGESATTPSARRIETPMRPG